MTSLVNFFNQYLPALAEGIVVITTLGGLMLYKFNAQEKRFDAHERRMELMDQRIDQAYQVLILHIVGEKK